MSSINKIVLVGTLLFFISALAVRPVSAAVEFTNKSRTETTAPEVKDNSTDKKKAETKVEEPAAEKPAPVKTKTDQTPAAADKSNSESGTLANPPTDEKTDQEKKDLAEKKKKKSKDYDYKKGRATTVQIQRVEGSTGTQVLTASHSDHDKTSTDSSGNDYSSKKNREKTINNADVRYSSDTEVIQLAVEKAVDKKIQPLEDLVRESQQRGPDFFTVLGLLGYIAGLLGLYSYIKTRQRKK